MNPLGFVVLSIAYSLLASGVVVSTFDCGICVVLSIAYSLLASGVVVFV